MIDHSARAKKVAATLKQRYGMDYFKTIGRMGGLVSKGGGFKNDPELAREAGRKGGQANLAKHGKEDLVKRMRGDHVG